MNLTAYVSGVHLMGYECLAIRTLRQLKGSVSYMPGSERVEFTTRSQTNPKKVTCIHCWNEMNDAAASWRAWEVRLGIAD